MAPQPPPRSWSPPVFRVPASNSDLKPLPVDVAILNAQHLALPTARFQGADDPVVHRSAEVFVLGAVHVRTCRKQPSSATTSPSLMREIASGSDVNTRLT